MKSQLEKHITCSAKETQKVGAKFARQILRQKQGKKAAVLALRGDLGAGKTTFLQGFAKGLGIKEKVLSPTFILVKRFKIKDYKFNNFYHIDCYRLHKPKEILELGFEEIIKNPENIVAIEWPERISTLIPKSAFQLSFIHSSSSERLVEIKV